ncbi:hypothetical protein ACHAXA_001073 [Cyclostephanos tholiformis]|uniref:Uncharacterized protein n=1 Tax=Cyclostephanos tholiformis TaxID=382380 RepID=A0ABD3R734_9STRA
MRVINTPRRHRTWASTSPCSYPSTASTALTRSKMMFSSSYRSLGCDRDDRDGTSSRHSIYRLPRRPEARRSREEYSPTSSLPRCWRTIYIANARPRAATSSSCAGSSESTGRKTTTSRRSFLLSHVAIAAATFVIPPPPIVIDPPLFTAIPSPPSTVGKDENCNDSSCLGVWDGMLADCPHDGDGAWTSGWWWGRGGGRGAGCVSSQDDTPGIFAEPWDYSDDVALPSSTPSSSSSSNAMGSEGGGGDENVESSSYASRMDRLILALDVTSRGRGDSVDVILREGRYLRSLVIDGNTGERSICEFYFTPDDTTVQFRLGATSTITNVASSSVPLSFGWRTSLLGGGGSMSNNERSERIRKALRYAKLPVLRNRKRTLFFVESDSLDGFGPGSAMLGPPEEMSPGEMALLEDLEEGGGREDEEDVEGVGRRRSENENRLGGIVPV